MELFERLIEQSAENVFPVRSKYSILQFEKFSIVIALAFELGIVTVTRLLFERKFTSPDMFESGERSTAVSSQLLPWIEVNKFDELGNVTDEREVLAEKSSIPPSPVSVERLSVERSQLLTEKLVIESALVGSVNPVRSVLDDSKTCPPSSSGDRSSVPVRPQAKKLRYVTFAVFDTPPKLIVARLGQLTF